MSELALLIFGIPDFVLANNILTIIDGPGEEIAAVKVYPNPFREWFIIDAGRHGGMGAGINEGSVEITDITGRVILSQNLNFLNSGTIKIDGLQQAQSGMYFVKINLNGRLSEQKVVKQ